MGRKKARAAGPGTATGLALVQLQQIRDALLGTTQNVYAVARRMFGYDPPAGKDAIFDDLEGLCHVRKCLECNRWKVIEEFEPDHDACRACLGEDDSDDDMGLGRDGEGG
jgi:hypothetical protein